MSRILRLKGRFYRTIPITNPRYEEETLELDADKTTLISLHCWNVGCPENPLDENYWVGMGFPQTTEEAQRIMNVFIRPAMDAARRAGILVCHVQTKSIAIKYPQHLEELEDEGKRSETVYAPPPAIPGYRESVLFRFHGKDYPTSSPLKDMDFPRVVAPLPGEPIVYTTKQFDKVLRKRGIINLIYTGFATDMCILYAEGGIIPMFNLGYRVLLIREATLGVEMPDWFEDRISTKWATRFFETHFGDTISFADFINACSNLAKSQS
jgi:nicotinamidase-related amidase